MISGNGILISYYIGQIDAKIIVIIISPLKSHEEIVVQQTNER